MTGLRLKGSQDRAIFAVSDVQGYDASPGARLPLSQIGHQDCNISETNAIVELYLYGLQYNFELSYDRLDTPIPIYISK